MSISPAHVGVAVWVVICLGALVWGGWPERALAGLLIADLASVRLLPGLSPGNAVHWWTLATDVIVLCGMTWIELRTPRKWLLCAIGFQVVTVLAHVPRILDASIHRWAYVATTTYAGYAVVLALLTGVFLHRAWKEDGHAAADRI